jgi:hypothetical protein
VLKKVNAVDARLHFGRFYATFGGGDGCYMEVVRRMGTSPLGDAREVTSCRV